MNRKGAQKLVAAVVLLAVPALAGPPLICHRLDIGNDKSLDGGRADALARNLSHFFMGTSGDTMNPLPAMSAKAGQ